MLIDSLDSYVLSDEEGEHQASHARLINADLIKQFQNALHSIDANAFRLWRFRARLIEAPKVIHFCAKTTGNIIHVLNKPCG